MKKVLGMFVGCFLLIGCSAAQIALTNTILEQIRANIIATCNYAIPSLNAIAAIAATFIPGAPSVVALVTQVTNGVCSAVQSAQLDQPGASFAGRNLVIVVNGVTVTGKVLPLNSRRR